MSETQFKKGHIPYTQEPVGTISLRQDSHGRYYYWIKVKDPHTWKLLHLKLWEDANGPVPEGSLITFCNGDSKDCRLDNLVCVTRAEHVVMNNGHCRGYDKESLKTAVALAHLRMDMHKRKTEKKK